MKPTKKQVEGSPCGGCGMWIKHPAQYHPWVACELFKALQDSDLVNDNVKEVVSYGMRARRLGVSLDDAMANISNVIK